jgi:NAD(P)-dependent dehydrogenase (short-subunit alcohol dehydrogenase family)
MAGLVPAMTNSDANKSVSMSDDYLKNPLSLFAVKGKTALITGATGAFGALAAQVLSGAGCNVVLAAGGAEALKKVAADCEKLGAKVETVNMRPSSAAICDKIVDAAVKRFGGVDIVVLAAGINKVQKIVDQAPEAFAEVMDVNVTQSWLMARAAGKQMLAQNRGGKVILMSSARGLLGHPAGYTAYCASKSAIDGITKGYRHHGECHRADGVPLAADRLDVRGQRALDRSAQGFYRPRSQRPPRRAIRPCRAAALPSLQGVGFLHRPHSLC